jgi:hypothetical protein
LPVDYNQLLTLFMGYQNFKVYCIVALEETQDGATYNILSVQRDSRLI